MIYLSGPELKIIILESANLDELKKGRPAKSPDESVLIAWTPDPAWLAAAISKELAATDGDGSNIGKLIDEAAKRPEKPVCPFFESEVTNYREKE